MRCVQAIACEVGRSLATYLRTSSVLGSLHRCQPCSCTFIEEEAAERATFAAAACRSSSRPRAQQPQPEAEPASRSRPIGLGTLGPLVLQKVCWKGTGGSRLQVLRFPSYPRLLRCFGEEGSGSEQVPAHRSKFKHPSSRSSKESGVRGVPK